MKDILKKIFNILFWVFISILFVIWIVDFIQVKNNKDPIFCLKEETHQYDDGEVYECVGMGYKVFKYNRTSMEKQTEFGPFYTSLRTSD